MSKSEIVTYTMPQSRLLEAIDAIPNFPGLKGVLALPKSAYKCRRVSGLTRLYVNGDEPPSLEVVDGKRHTPYGYETELMKKGLRVCAPDIGLILGGFSSSIELALTNLDGRYGNSMFSMKDMKCFLKDCIGEAGYQGSVTAENGFECDDPLYLSVSLCCGDEEVCRGFGADVVVRALFHEVTDNREAAINADGLFRYLEAILGKDNRVVSNLTTFTIGGRVLKPVN